MKKTQLYYVEKNGVTVVFQGYLDNEGKEWIYPVKQIIKSKENEN
jgi:hypothetical protein